MLQAVYSWLYTYANDCTGSTMRLNIQIISFNAASVFDCELSWLSCVLFSDKGNIYSLCMQTHTHTYEQEQIELSERLGEWGEESERESWNY